MQLQLLYNLGDKEKKSPQEKATQQALILKHFSRINRNAIALKGSFSNT